MRVTSRKSGAYEGNFYLRCQEVKPTGKVADKISGNFFQRPFWNVSRVHYL